MYPRGGGRRRRTATGSGGARECGRVLPRLPHDSQSLLVGHVWGGGVVLGQPRDGARRLTATRSRNLPKAVSRARQPKPSARAVSLGSAMRRLALETCPLSAAGELSEH